MLNVCLWLNYSAFFLFIAEYWLELHTCKLCVLLTIPVVHKLERTSEQDTRWIFVLFCGNPLFCSIAYRLLGSRVSIQYLWMMARLGCKSRKRGGPHHRSKIIYVHTYSQCLFIWVLMQYVPAEDWQEMKFCICKLDLLVCPRHGLDCGLEGCVGSLE